MSDASDISKLLVNASSLVFVAGAPFFLLRTTVLLVN